ncbi:MAG: substrate-binding domain-containing protein [Desulfobacterales bacterium]
MKKLLYLLLIVVIFFGFSGTGAFADVAVIANKNIPENSLSNSEIKKISLGKIVKWPDNTPVHFVTLEGDIHREFLKTYIKRSTSQYKNHWRKMIFTGKGCEPKCFKTEAELIQYVSQTDGAIGYIGQRTGTENVKVLEVY